MALRRRRCHNIMVFRGLTTLMLIGLPLAAAGASRDIGAAVTVVAPTAEIEVTSYQPKGTASSLPEVALQGHPGQTFSYQTAARTGRLTLDAHGGAVFRIEAADGAEIMLHYD